MERRTDGGGGQPRAAHDGIPNDVLREVFARLDAGDPAGGWAELERWLEALHAPGTPPSPFPAAEGVCEDSSRAPARDRPWCQGAGAEPSRTEEIPRRGSADASEASKALEPEESSPTHGSACSLGDASAGVGLVRAVAQEPSLRALEREILLRLQPRVAELPDDGDLTAFFVSLTVPAGTTDAVLMAYARRFAWELAKSSGRGCGALLFLDPKQPDHPHVHGIVFAPDADRGALLDRWCTLTGAHRAAHRTARAAKFIGGQPAHRGRGGAAMLAAHFAKVLDYALAPTHARSPGPVTGWACASGALAGPWRASLRAAGATPAPRPGSARKSRARPRKALACGWCGRSLADVQSHARWCRPGCRVAACRARRAVAQLPPDLRALYDATVAHHLTAGIPLRAAHRAAMKAVSRASPAALPGPSPRRGKGRKASPVATPQSVTPPAAGSDPLEFKNPQTPPVTGPSVRPDLLAPPDVSTPSSPRVDTPVAPPLSTSATPTVDTPVDTPVSTPAPREHTPVSPGPAEFVRCDDGIVVWEGWRTSDGIVRRWDEVWGPELPRPPFAQPVPPASRSGPAQCALPLAREATTGAPRSAALAVGRPSPAPFSAPGVEGSANVETQVNHACTPPTRRVSTSSPPSGVSTPASPGVDTPNSGTPRHQPGARSPA